MTNELADHFLSLHQPGLPLVMPNPWDRGSAVLFASLGFKALATTSSGFAATLGRLDGGVDRDEAIAHAAEIVSATDLPVSGDLENGFGDGPEDAATTVSLAIGTGLAGCSIEDYGPEAGVYDLGLATERVAAAAEAAHGPERLVLTARAENLIRGVDDLDDTIARLLAYQDAGADVLFAPGLSSAEDVRRVVEAVDRPVNVLARPGLPSIAGLAELGVARVSVGGSLAFAGWGAVATAARELLDDGTYGYWDTTKVGIHEVRAAFGRPS